DLCADDSLKLKVSYGADYSYQWYHDGIEMPFTDNYKMVALAAGYYWCTITTYYGCARTTDTLTVYNSGECRVGEFSGAGSISVYPNPATSDFTVTMETETHENSVVAVELFSLTGESVYVNVSEMIDGNLYLNINNYTLPAGIYTLKINASSSSYTTKVVLQ
ncbi:MAG: T9SS type A sorting domain-containing protein, partial [Chitinophagales bacterium]|nr:T9SS type A sorting domain-containing protein [Chitinophagales bacterium]